MNSLLDSVLNALPQTQCRLCGYDDCLGYAESIIENSENINKCQPGGETTVRILSDILGDGKEKYKQEITTKKEKINGVWIRESECIGCVKCLDVCPVGAILGGVKKVHFASLEICNGCNLCISVCPVDCIDAIEHPNYKNPFEIAEQSISRYRLKRAKSKLLEKR